MNELLNNETMTTTQINKVQIAINETEESLKRALRYSEDLQDKDLIAFYNNHIETLKSMIS